jgi:hypothetical protein
MPMSCARSTPCGRSIRRPYHCPGPAGSDPSGYRSPPALKAERRSPAR